ncbi:hypothetical protein EDB89DRAFT_2037152, partial [Lactarius sanguifluus]
DIFFTLLYFTLLYFRFCFVSLGPSKPVPGNVSHLPPPPPCLSPPHHFFSTLQEAHPTPQLSQPSQVPVALARPKSTTTNIPSRYARSGATPSHYDRQAPPRRCAMPSQHTKPVTTTSRAATPPQHDG